MDEYAGEIAEALRCRLETCSPRDMKEIDLMGTEAFLGHITAVLVRCERAGKKGVRLALETRVLTNCIRSDNLKRKIEGLELLGRKYEIPTMSN